MYNCFYRNNGQAQIKAPEKKINDKISRDSLLGIQETIHNDKTFSLHSFNECLKSLLKRLNDVIF